MEDGVKLREIETIVSADLLELLMLWCTIIMQQYILQCGNTKMTCYVQHLNYETYLLHTVCVALAPVVSCRCGIVRLGLEAHFLLKV